MLNLMSIKKTALVLISITSLAFVGNAFAKGHGNPHERGHDMQKQVRFVMSKLDLSEDQKQQIKDIKMDLKNELKILKENTVKGEDRKEMQALLMAESFDEAAFVQLQQKHQAKKQQFSLINARSMNKVFNVLTTEQKLKYIEIKDQKQKNRKNKKMGKQRNKGNKNGNNQENNESIN